ncbi:Acetamidase [Hypsizygus marmoreus]|uniref:amidase n=1 Tax=Hypsizygus marmoreus TaxID=39966 RepID=A0A369JGL4_HYPMA|nr:Acetamidase [Hypsizygus marmoreus]
MAPTWRQLVAEKKLRQEATIPNEWILPSLPPKDQLNITTFPESSGLLSSKEIDITQSHVDVLLANLANGTWTAVEVTTAFSKRAIIAHQLTNCLTEIFIDRAMARAAELDEHLKATGKVAGPLHGLPISLKDQISLKGIESTMGYVSWIGKFPEQNSVLVDVLEAAGAVLYVKTNVPQTLMWPETYNHIFGRTVNPNNRSLTSGGSSGGEGALVALRGSPIGVGSDIGGSIRIPSAFCGVYGLRPSTGRVPYSGCVNSLEGQDSIPSALGPISNSIFGLKAFMKAVIGQKPWLYDPLVIRKAWDEDAYALADHGRGEGGLCFGILWDDGDVRPHPPVLRGLRKVKEALEASGHKVIDWTPHKHKEIYEIGFSIWASGLSEDYYVTTEPTGEPVLTSMTLDEEDVLTAAKDVLPANAVLVPSTFVPGSGPNTVSAYTLWQRHKAKRDLRQEYVNHWQASAGRTGTGRPVDALISPVAPFVAPPHGKNTSANYTLVWNVLDYPALVIPVSRVDQELDTKQPAHKFLSEDDKANYEAYDPAIYRDAPVSVQLVGRTLEEEAVIAMAEIVDAALKVGA